MSQRSEACAGVPGACTRVGVHSRLAGTKKTAIAAIAAAFITSSVRAGEVRRFRGELAETNPLHAARSSQNAPALSRPVRSQLCGSAKVAQKKIRIAHGISSRVSLWERK